jgi:hypothetical protein
MARHWRISAGLLLIAAAGCWFWPSLGSAAQLEERLHAAAPRILQSLENQKFETIGVLKFLVRFGTQGSYESDIGTFNMLVADRLEVALAQAALRDNSDVRLVRQASNVAAQVQGASHLTKTGRQALFDALYPLSRTQDAAKVRVDAFVTGFVEIHPDLDEINVGVVAVGRDKGEFSRLIEPMKVKIDATILNELGFNYRLRGASDDPVQAALRYRDDPHKESPLLASRAAPLPEGPLLLLKVLYDGEPAPPVLRGTRLTVPNPRPGQDVTFELKRLDQLPETLGAVLKVNGENTLDREPQPDFHCRKWVFAPGDPPVTIRGYQVKGMKDKAQKFHLATPEQSRAMAPLYGADVGTISLTVFRESPKPAAPPARLSAAETSEIEAISRIAFPEESRRAMRSAEVQSPPPSADEGERLIIPGKVIDSPVTRVGVDFCPDPILSVVIWYYQP